MKRKGEPGLSRKQAAKGGLARARALKPEERSHIARQAAVARWRREGKSPSVVYAICGSEDSPLRLGDVEIPCYVLEDERRVLSQRGFTAALGKGSKANASWLPDLALQKGIGPFIGEDLADRLRSAIRFVPPNGGRSAYGFEAEILADVCDAILAARRAGALSRNQVSLAEKCELLVRGFARVGINALVDEATGYQELRERNALAKILEKFIANELRKWVKTFPPDYYREMYRLRGLEYPPRAGNKMPQYFGTLTNSIVYDRLAPGVRAALKEKAPKDGTGRHRDKLHQYLTEDIGLPALREHLAATIATMKLSDDWERFITNLDRVKPRWGTQAKLPLGLRGDDSD